MRRYAAKVDLVSTSGTHLRWIPAAVAEALVGAEHAVVTNQNGKVRGIQLVQCAETSAQRIGPPSPLTPLSYATRFVRKLKLASGHVVYEHHPRSLD
jgi:hypothetical protein